MRGFFTPKRYLRPCQLSRKRTRSVAVATAVCCFGAVIARFA
ncbi:hypothetical protein ALP99_102703 [Pseudomonas syringae pv. tomato]|uniref:Uncharacterized protein n=3 Tax=Pseudomonas syringae group TaxID=136849 RepID=A0A3M3R580_9PSED|nr:Unknown protein sequence [Pseudomonas syringae pv. maculicola str. M6]KPW44620.1 hypothetical protein ALO86_102319 [Pseudomonas syringae pv. berberidis]KPW47025.1 hypothetical protein ALO88_102833 [Pseudomonas syringae pv. antirrhini]KPX71058.1 hypothetical protein ALO84_102370 [Pseudomonas syringae pv. maculicola]KPY15095.1 hypothetical protein ALO54_102577 [Pseudomonas syringae pv. philadelphi]KPY92438.1 hypothetical protein ALO36_104103 [Pseudomonas syringae pv. tomato]RMM12590.1 hypoth